MTVDFNNLNINNLQPENEYENNIIYFLKDWFSDDGKVKVQTSGSTGIPKVFEIEKEKMRNSAEMTCDFLGLKIGDKALNCLPIEYISGKMMVVRAIERKLQLMIKNPSTKPLEDLDEYIGFCAMTPLQVENSSDKIHLIKKLIIGGAAVSESLKSKIFEVFRQQSQISDFKSQIFETYGMSETLSHIALKEIYPNSQEWFTAFEGIEISADERGCLKISAPKLNDQILQTNDLVEIRDENRFRFLGRIDHVINSGGAKIFPEELEALVKKEISNEVIFLGLKDEVLGQKLILLIEDVDCSKDGQSERSRKLKSQISNLKFEKSFHKPKDIIFVEEIPRTPNGKVNRKELLNLISGM